MSASQIDPHSTDWRLTKLKAQSKLDHYRALLEQTRDPILAAEARGAITALKDVLTWGEPPVVLREPEAEDNGNTTVPQTY